MIRNASRAVSALAIGVATLFSAGCSDSSAAQCVRSADSKICYVRDHPAGGSIDVSGLDPGSTLTISSKEFGSARYVIDDAGTVDGKVGFVNGLGTSVVLTITGTTASKEVLVANFNS